MNPVQVPKNGGQSVNILGIPMLIRVHGGETNGTLAVVESHDSPGGGPPAHVHHREDETFQILEGEYEFRIGGKTITARSGDTLFAPRDIPHSYHCTGKAGGKLMVVLTPAGFENFFAEIGAMSPEQQQDLPRVIEIAQKFGLEFLPPPGV
jgi:quercetin dioxygenase-like cupin family protein